jgi:hypothetical protein
VVHPHSKLLSTKVRAFADDCAAGLKSMKFD